MDTLERILELQKQSGLTVKALEAATGISNGSFSKWKKGTYAPRYECKSNNHRKPVNSHVPL